MPLLRPLARLFRDRRAATAVEYGLVCALVVIAALVAIRGLAGATIGTLQNVSTTVSTAVR